MAPLHYIGNEGEKIELNLNYKCIAEQVGEMGSLKLTHHFKPLTLIDGCK
jgi:hypothetical protein